MFDLLPRNRVGTLIREARYSLGLSFGGVARRLGAVKLRQVAKLSAEVVKIEREFLRDRDLLERVAKALAIPEDRFARAVNDEQTESSALIEAWLDEPVEPEIYWMPGPVVVVYPVPSSITKEDEAVEYTRQFSADRERVQLAWSRRKTHWFSRGVLKTSRVETEPADMPHMSVGGKAFVFMTAISKGR